MKIITTILLIPIFILLPLFCQGQVQVVENGDVGIGTNTPDSKLHIIQNNAATPALEITKPAYSLNNIRFTSTSGSDRYSQISIDGAYNQSFRIELDPLDNYSFDQFQINKDGDVKLYYIDSNDRHHWYIEGQEKMHLSAAGKLGIGTTTPITKLQIDDYSPLITLRRNTTNGGYIQGIQTEEQSGSKSWFYGNHGLNSFVVSRGDYNDMPLLTITSNNVPLARFNSRIKIVNASNPSNTASSPLHIQNDKGTVSMFLGEYINTNSFLPDESAGDIRFNGAGVAWGDFAYYPTGGDNGEYGHFRLSRAGSNIVTTPNAKLGVGSLYVNDFVGINTASPTTNLDVNGDAKVSGSLKIEDVINLNALSSPPSGPVAGDIYLDDGTNTGGSPKLRYYTGSTWINL